MKRPANDHGVFIIEVTRKDGSRFVTSTRERAVVRTVAHRHGLSARVSHWVEDVPHDRRAANPTDGWRLNERYAL